MVDTQTENGNGKQTRKRNPMHPVLTLEDAVARTQKLHDASPKRAIAPPVAAKTWELSPTSSTAIQTISTLKQYGLIDDEKNDSGNRMLTVTQLGYRIILDKRPDSQERLEAIREAALLPKVMAELWEESNGGDVGDVSLNHYLTVERPEYQFYEDAAPGVIETFRKNIEFAKLRSSDILDEESEEDAESEDQDNGSGSNPPPPPPLKDRLKVNPGQISASITLHGDGDFQVVAPETIDQTNKPLLVAWLRGFIARLGAGDVPPDELDPPDIPADTDNPS